jgi:RimJ/RimL family protein N-acetyltransferase
MSFGWQGEKVRLVPLERGRHFENAVRWLNDPDVTRWLLIGDFPLTRLAEEEFFDRAARESPEQVVFAVETHAEEHIGMCGLHQLDYRQGTAAVGIVIGRPPLWNQGFGRDALAVLTRYAFDVLGLRLLLAEVFAENAPSLKILVRNGYREVGRVPVRRWKRGAYRDEVLLVRLRDESPAEPPAVT